MTETNIAIGEKPPELLQANESLLKQFRAEKPDLEGQIQPEESVRKSLRVINDLDSSRSGLLLTQNGDRRSWF